MPRLILLGDGKAAPLTQQPFLNEAGLQGLLEQYPELIALDDVDPAPSALVPIGREVVLSGQSLDLLFIDNSGVLTAVETKLRQNPEIRRKVVGQVLEYAAYLSAWNVDDVEQQATRYLAAEDTPSRFQGRALLELVSSAPSEPEEVEQPNAALLRDRIADNLTRGNIRLIIAVDRIVDALRQTVTFLNAGSRFSIFLLEVEEYRAEDRFTIASINLYGGPALIRRSEPDHQRWEELRFLAALAAGAAPDDASVARQLYSFMAEEADSLIWGTGKSTGSVGFAIRRSGARFTVFGVTTAGQLYVSTGVLNKRLPLHERSSFLSALRASGIDAADDLLQRDTSWLQVPAKCLADSDRLKRFQSAVRQLQQPTLP